MYRYLSIAVLGAAISLAACSSDSTDEAAAKLDDAKGAAGEMLDSAQEAGAATAGDMLDAAKTAGSTAMEEGGNLTDAGNAALETAKTAGDDLATTAIDTGNQMMQAGKQELTEKAQKMQQAVEQSVEEETDVVIND